MELFFYAVRVASVSFPSHVSYMQNDAIVMVIIWLSCSPFGYIVKDFQTHTGWATKPIKRIQ